MLAWHNWFGYCVGASKTLMVCPIYAVAGGPTSYANDCLPTAPINGRPERLLYPVCPLHRARLHPLLVGHRDIPGTGDEIYRHAERLR